MIDYEWLPLDLIEKLEPVAADLGVSEVARSKRGFLTAYKQNKINDYWIIRRQGFLSRHMAFVKKNNELLWKDGYPTRRHLALIMWAYSPDVKRLYKLMSKSK